MFFSKINIQPFETFPFPVFWLIYSIFSPRIERDIFIKFLSGYFHLKKKKNTRKMSFIFLEYFGISRWEELFFFFRTNFLSQPQHGGFAKGEESNIIFREKWASQADYLGILVELKLFPLFSRHFIAFIFFEIHIFLLKMEPELSFQLYPLLFSYNTRKYKSWSLNLDIRCYPPLHRFRYANSICDIINNFPLAFYTYASRFRCSLVVVD